MYDTIEFAAFVASILGTFLVIGKSRWGYAVWFVSNILWMVFAVSVNAPWLCFTQGCFAGLSLYGFARWTREAAETETEEHQRKVRSTYRGGGEASGATWETAAERETHPEGGETECRTS